MSRLRFTVPVLILTAAQVALCLSHPGVESDTAAKRGRIEDAVVLRESAGAPRELPLETNGGPALAELPPGAIPPLVCFIDAEPVCELGKAPTVRVHLANATDHDLTLIGCLEGSSDRLRYPHCYFEVIPPRTDFVATIRKHRDCWHINPLREWEFVTVPAGRPFDPFHHPNPPAGQGGFYRAHQLDPRVFSAEGTYRLRFVYSTDCREHRGWVSRSGQPDDPRVLSLIEHVPRVEVRSREVTVTVVDPARTRLARNEQD